MSEKCSFCSNCSLETEDNVRFCSECGFVVSETSFQDDIPEHFRSGQSTMNSASIGPLNVYRPAYWMKSSYLESNSKLLSVSKRLGLQLLVHCAEHFRFDKSMREESLAMYRRAVNEPQFNSCCRETKMVMAGVCAFLILSQNKLVITKHTVAKQVGCSIHEFGRVYKQMLQLEWIERPAHYAIECHVQSTLQSLGFNPSELNSIVQTTTELVRLQQRCLLIESSLPFNIILATAFFAWKAEQIETRFKVTLEKFCRQFNITNANLRKHAAPIQKLLAAFVSLLPWAQVAPSKSAKRLVVYHIKDILDNPQTIVNDYVASLPKTKKPAVKRRLQQFDLEDDGDRDISDSEIDCYIRSDSEIKLIKKLKERIN